MATAEDYAAWIVKNQDRRGTPEFETVAAAYQVAKRPKAELPPMNVDPTEGMSTMDKLRAGAGKALADVGRGIGQAVGMVSSDDVKESKKLDAPLMNTGAGTVGNIAGNIAAFAPTAMIPGANTVTGAALIGGASNALMTPGDFGERGLAGLLGATGGAAGQLIPKAIGTVRAAAEPLTSAGRDKIIGRTMNKAVGDDTAAVVARLRGAQPLVPGSMPTAAEVAESGGMAALQRAMSAADPEAYTNRAMAQSAARKGAIEDIAGTAAEREAAYSARDKAAQTMYQRARDSDKMRRALAIEQEVNKDAARVGLTLGTGLPAQRSENEAIAAALRPSKALEDLAKRPDFKGYIESAKRLAANKGDDIGNPLTSAQGLHYIKLAIDDALEPSATNALARNARGATTDMKERLLKELDSLSPQYAVARQGYTQASEPINQMEVGKVLAEKLRGPLSDHGALASETGATFARALRNEGEQTARNATGFKQGLADVMSPDQMGTINNVAKDLARKANAQDLGRGPGSNTFQNFAMDNLAQSMGVPSAVKSMLGVVPGMSPTMTLLAKGAQGVGGLAYKKADEQIRQDMAQALLNPQASARLMELASTPGALAKALKALPANVQKALPPEEVLRLLQASSGVAGVGLANARQE